MNLLNNAIKFTEKGTVTLKVRYISNHGVRFEIIDTGTGMTPAEMEYLFLPFEQVGEGNKQIEGTGLGLAISQKFVQMMGSHIYVESEKNVGSIFWFDINLPSV